MKKIFIAAFCFLTIYVQAKPAQILLIRHGEKAESGEELSVKGKERAAALAPYFLWTEEYMRFGPAVGLFAVNTSAEDRCYCSQETLAPLAYYLNSTVEHPVIDREFRLLAQGILNNPNYNNRTVIVCWNHNFIPQFAHVLGAESVPATWPEKVYDHVWMIRYLDDGQVDFRIIEQALMFGDSPQNIRNRPSRSTANQQPGPNLVFPSTSLEKYKINLQENRMELLPPGTSLQLPGMNVQQPGMNVQQPGMNVQQPGMNVQQPGMNVQQPGMNVQQPGMNVQQPGMNVQQPGMNVQQPGMNPGGQNNLSPSKNCK